MLVLLLAASVTGCGNEAAEVTTESDPDVPDPVITLIRTKTPQAPYNENDYKGTKPPQQNNNNNNNDKDEEKEKPDIQEKGDGLELDGYIQLLNYIDRGSLSGPSGWNRHPVDDLFDGVFETTDQGTNKYGHGESNFTVSWTLEQSLVLDAYTIITGSDAEEYVDRNPSSWTVTASEDGENWVTLHTVEEGNLPAANYAPVTFTFDNDVPYRYYRWNIESTVGNSGFQASELLLYTSADNEILPINDDLSKLIYPEYGASAELAKEAVPLTGDEAFAFIDSHESLANEVNRDSLFTEAKLYGDGPLVNLFDSIYTEQNFGQNGGKTGASGTQLRISWLMNSETTIGAYAMVTGNDSEEYSDRNPLAWTLYGSADGNQWQVIDAVSDGKLPAANFEPCVYEIDSPSAYRYYCLVIEGTGDGFQLCELILMK